jgi:hypothetical protein
MWSNYRKEMIEDAGIAIFLFGNKMAGTDLVESNGMLEEFELALQNNCIPIPLGATGYVAEKLWKKIKIELDKYGYITADLKQAFEILGDSSKSNKDLINDIIKIVNLLQ